MNLSQTDWRYQQNSLILNVNVNNMFFVWRRFKKLFCLKMGGKRLIQKWKQREDQLIHIQMHTRANSLKLGHLVLQIIMKYYLSSTTFPKQSNTIRELIHWSEIHRYQQASSKCPLFLSWYFLKWKCKASLLLGILSLNKIAQNYLLVESQIASNKLLMQNLNSFSPILGKCGKCW